MTELSVRTPGDSSEDRPQLSPWRVAVALVLLASALGAASVWVKEQVAGATHAVTKSTWFAPYVDTTLTPTLQFQDPSVNPARQAVLGFVVAANPRSCVPSWGANYSLAQAESDLSLDNRITQYESIGGSLAISFGGRDNTELSVACTNVDTLARDYLSVIDRYHANVMDFDVEGAALDNWTSIQRRALAVARVEKSVAQRGGHLAVWLTLPGETDGLQSNALAVVSAFLHAKVALAGVNIMAMDFTPSPADMRVATESALRQVPTSYREGAEALGMRTGYGLRKVVLRTALPGIVTGLLIAESITVGETAPLLYTAGITNNLPNWQLVHHPIGYLTYYVWTDWNQPLASLHYISYDASLILLVMVLSLLVVSRVIVARSQRHSESVR